MLIGNMLPMSAFCSYKEIYSRCEGVDMEQEKAKVNRITEGSIFGQLLLFFFPILFGTFFQQLYNTADAMVVGRFVGKQALAAVGGTTSTLINLLVGFFVGLSSGATVVISQFYGAKKSDKVHWAVHTSITFSVIGGIVFMLIGIIGSPFALRAMKTPEDVLGHAMIYIRIYFLGMTANLLYNMGAGILRAVGDSKRPLYFLITSAVINVFLDVAFIVRLGMGVRGCAYATVIAQGISAALCLVYIIRKFDILKLKREDFRLSFKTMGRLLGMGIPMGLQFSITAVGTIIVQGAVNAFGAVYIAGFSAAGKIQSTVSTVFVAFGATVATFVGQNRGAGRMDRVRQGVKITQIMVFVWSAFMILFIHFLGETLIGIFIDPSEKEVMEAAKTYFKAVSWCYPFLGSIFLYRNALQGLGYGLVPMMGGIFELAARAAIVSSMAGLAGYVGVCLADPAAWLAALIPIVPYYFYRIKHLGPAR